MKQKLILFSVITLIIAGSVLFFKPANAPSELNLQMIDIASSTLNESKKTLNNEILTMNEISNTSNGLNEDIEKKQSIRFLCENKKEIEGIMYVGGKNPRIEMTLIDYEMQVVGVENESRRLMLEQIPVEKGVKYMNGLKNIVMTGKGDSVTIVENGTPIFKNCSMVTLL